MKELIENIYSFLSYAKKLSLNEHDAEDMVQELAYNVMKNKHIFLSKNNKEQRNMMAWKLKRIYVDKWRTKIHFKEIELEDEINNVCHNNIFGKLLEDDLKIYLAQLSEYRYRLLKMTIEGYSKDEICQIAGIKRSNYNDSISRIRRTFKMKII